MEHTSPDEVIQTLMMLAVAIIAGLFVFKKLIKDWLSTDTESNIIKLMHSELERMSQQNTALSIELGRLHTEVILLNQELQKLTVENQRLQIEVMNLTTELNNFKQLRIGEKLWQDLG
jgi:predicted  nucleic acid-binding Zn-ribbon protein